MLKKLIVQASHYSIAGLLTTFAGIISFPIVTRLLTVSEYGLLSLISSTITLMAAFGKAGLQFSVVRFYADLHAARASYTRPQFYSTAVLGMAGLGVLVTALWAAGTLIVPERWWPDPQLRLVFCLVAGLILAEVLTSLFSSLLQAQQRSARLSVFEVAKRYAILGAVVIFLFFISQDLTGFYTATILAEVVVVTVLGWVTLRGLPVDSRQFDGSLLKEMLLYGVPLVGNEFAAILLGLGDRYIIQWLLNSSALGVYAAAYSICQYVQLIFIVALFRAIRPIYLRLWNERGEAETRAFIQRSLYMYLMLGLPIIAGVSAVGPDLLVLLASDKYASDRTVIPYVIAGMIAYGSVSMVGAGLHINKQGATLMTITLIAAGSNILFNILLIPRIGIQGAAIATLLSYLLMALLVGIKGAGILRIRIPWLAAVKFASLSILMYAALMHIELNTKVATLAVRVICGAGLYGVLLLTCDAAARGHVRAFVRNVVDSRGATRP